MLLRTNKNQETDIQIEKEVSSPTCRKLAYDYAEIAKAQIPPQPTYKEPDYPLGNTVPESVIIKSRFDTVYNKILNLCELNLRDKTQYEILTGMIGMEEYHKDAETQQY